MAEQAGTSFIQLVPIFDVLNYEVASAWMAECKKGMATKEPDCLFYDFTVSEDKKKIMCREAYVDASDLALHLKNVGASLGEQLNEKKSLKLVSLDVHCPAAMLEDCKTACKGLPAKFFTTRCPTGDTGTLAKRGNLSKRNGNTDLGEAKSFVQLCPMFEIGDHDGAKAFMDECNTYMSSNEKGCLFYDFTVEQDGGRALCREAYVNPAALKEHLDHVAKPLGQVLDSKALKLLSLDVHCPADMLDGCKAIADAFKPTYYVTYDSPAGDVGSLAQRGEFTYHD